MDLIKKIISQKNVGDSSNYDRVFSDLRSMRHSPVETFVFDGHEISWIYFRSADFYEDIIHDEDVISGDEQPIYFYLRNQDLTFESVFCSPYFENRSKFLADRIVVISNVWVFGRFFPGLHDFARRPVRIMSNEPFPRTPIKKLNYHFRTMLETYQRRTKPIFEWVDANYRTGEKGWRKIAKRNKPSKKHDQKASS